MRKREVIAALRWIELVLITDIETCRLA